MLQRVDAWLAGRRLEDVTLAGYLAEFHWQGRAASKASTAARRRFRGLPRRQAELGRQRTTRVLAGYRRTGVERSRGDLAAVLATCERPRCRGRRVESEAVAVERGRVDAEIAGLLFMAGMRRSGSALRWADVAPRGRQRRAAGDGPSQQVQTRRPRRGRAGS